jgi:hypothetical protein
VCGDAQVGFEFEALHPVGEAALDGFMVALRIFGRVWQLRGCARRYGRRGRCAKASLGLLGATVRFFQSITIPLRRLGVRSGVDLGLRGRCGRCRRFWLRFGGRSLGGEFGQGGVVAAGFADFPMRFMRRLRLVPLGDDIGDRRRGLGDFGLSRRCCV